MQSTQGRYWLGLLVLFALAYKIIRSMSRISKPQRSKNPFSLIQKNPDAWRGLVKADSKGFLEFDTVVHGVRAGFINLFNRYFLRGLNTIEEIFPVYAPPFENDTEAYIRQVSKLTGFTPDQILSIDDYFHLGKAIVKVESGSNWVSDAELLEGFKLAKDKLNL